MKKYDKITFLKADFFTHIFLKKSAIFTKLWDSCETKIEKYFPQVLKIPGFEYILNKLPGFGGDWEQYYEIRMEWKE